MKHALLFLVALMVMAAEPKGPLLLQALTAAPGPACVHDRGLHGSALLVAVIGRRGTHAPRKLIRTERLPHSP
jgi:hypothetical protein